MSSKAKTPNNAKKVECDGRTDRPTDGPTKRGVESRSARLKIKITYANFLCTYLHYDCIFFSSNYNLCPPCMTIGNHLESRLHGFAIFKELFGELLKRMLLYCQTLQQQMSGGLTYLICYGQIKFFAIIGNEKKWGPSFYICYRQIFVIPGSIMGVFLLTTKNVLVPVERVYSMNTYSTISTVPRGSEQSE